MDHAWRGAGADGRLYAEGLPPARWQVSVVFDDGTLRDLGELELAAGERRELGWIE